MGFKEKLFDRRLAVHNEVHQGLSDIIREARFSDETLRILVSAKQKSRFLFGKNVGEMISEIIERGAKMTYYQQSLNGLPVGGERSKLVEKEHEEVSWLSKKLVSFSSEFDEYLLFESKP